MAALFNNELSTSREVIVNLSEGGPSVLETPMANLCLGRPGSSRRKMTFGLLIVLCLTLLIASVVIHRRTNKELGVVYPDVRRNLSSVDVYHGVKVEDPYRWLEENSTATTKFVEDQNRLTHSFLDAAKIPRDVRTVMENQLTGLYANQWLYEIPQKAGSKYYSKVSKVLRKNSYQLVIYVQDQVDGPRRVLLDENEDPEFAESMRNMKALVYSSNGQLIAYYLTSKEKQGEKKDEGSTEVSGPNKIVFVDTSIGSKVEVLLLYGQPEGFELIQFSEDDQGLFYLQQGSASSPAVAGAVPVSKNKTEMGSKIRIWFHKIGTPQESDIIVGETSESNEPFSTPYRFSDDGAYLLLKKRYPKDDDDRSILVVPLELGGVKTLNQPQAPSLLLKYHARTDYDDYTYIANQGRKFFLEAGRTNSTIVSIDLAASSVAIPDETSLTQFMPEVRAESLSYTVATDSDKLLMVYQKESKIILEWRRLNDSALVRNFENLPNGYIRDMTSNWMENEIFFAHVNLVSSASTYHCKLNPDTSVECKVIRQAQIPGIDLSTFVHKKIFYQNSAGTSMPIHLLHKKDVIPGKIYPMLLQQGDFKRAFRGRQVFVENSDGIYAIAQVQEPPYLRNRPNQPVTVRQFQHQSIVDDLELAIDLLVKNNYTRPQKLAIMGGWDVATLVNRRPSVCGAAIVQVGGKLDLLRHREHCGETNNDDHCNQVGGPEDEENFKKLFAASPLHNIQPSKNDSIQYPAIFVNTWLKSKWSFPSQSFKYIAELQYKIGRSGQQTNPLLLRVDTTSVDNIWYHLNEEHVKSMADMYTFLVETIGLDFKAISS